MAAPFEYKIPQNMETPVTYGEVGAFYFRYTYARSADSIKNNDKGQDFLTLFSDGGRLVFALCDGVSQSFYGDLAANLLGGYLIEFFREVSPKENPEKIKADLSFFLHHVTETSSRQVREYPLPTGIPPMFAGVLEKKKQMGSESTFVAGVLDVTEDMACFAWMGDTRLRLWNSEIEVTNQLGGNFHTKERWSTKKGPVGNVHVICLPAYTFNHLMAYSDGFIFLDGAITQEVAAHPWAHQSIDEFVRDSSRRPSSDDISFLEVWCEIKPIIPDGNGTLPPPQIEMPLITSPLDSIDMTWMPVPGANEYEVEVSSDVGVLSNHKVEQNYWRIENLTQQARSVTIRAWSGSTPGVWSNPFPIPVKNDPEEIIGDVFPPEEISVSPINNNQGKDSAKVLKLDNLSLMFIAFMTFFTFVGLGMIYLGIYNKNPQMLFSTENIAMPTIYQEQNFYPSNTPFILPGTENTPHVSHGKAVVKETQLLQFPNPYSKTLLPPSIGEEVFILYKHRIDIPEKTYFYYIQWAKGKGWMRSSWLDLSGIDESQIPFAP